jgi:hypothetical protein
LVLWICYVYLIWKPESLCERGRIC